MNRSKPDQPAKKGRTINSPLVEAVDERTVRMNLNISKAFHKRIKHKALDEDKTVTELVIQALHEYLRGESK